LSPSNRSRGSRTHRSGWRRAGGIADLATFGVGVLVGSQISEGPALFLTFRYEAENLLAGASPGLEPGAVQWLHLGYGHGIDKDVMGAIDCIDPERSSRK
jgi:hypothetical protein